MLLVDIWFSNLKKLSENLQVGLFYLSCRQRTLFELQRAKAWAGVLSP